APLDGLLPERDLEHGLLAGAHEHVRQQARRVPEVPHLERLPPERDAGEDEPAVGIGGRTDEGFGAHDDDVRAGEGYLRVGVADDAADGLAAVLGSGGGRREEDEEEADERAEQRGGHAGGGWVRGTPPSLSPRCRRLRPRPADWTRYRVRSRRLGPLL